MRGFILYKSPAYLCRVMGRVRFKMSVFFLAGLLLLSSGLSAQRYFVRSAQVSFLSDAPLEKIEAVSTGLQGVIDISQRTFAFSIPVRSFEGFNSALQAEHFNENYVESEKFPKSYFTGKIVDEFDVTKPGKYMVRAKGVFTIRGVAREKIVRAVLDVKKDKIILNSEFTLLLDDYSIRIPRVVYQKIAPEINVKMNAELAEID